MKERKAINSNLGGTMNDYNTWVDGLTDADKEAMAKEDRADFETALDEIFGA